MYNGEWENDKPNGEGNLRSEGVGVLTKYKGDRYNGEWKDGKKDGEGIFLK